MLKRTVTLHCPRCLLANLLLIASASVPMVRAGSSVTLTPSVPSPAPVGTRLTWSASAPDIGTENVWYRFRERRPDGSFRMIRDFSPGKELDWTASEREGNYEIEVSARNNDTGEIQKTIQFFEMTSRV